MIYVAHRINEITPLKGIPSEMGVEIDLRSNGNEIILHHEPFSSGVLLKEWLKFYQHSLLILNVKEEGLEDKILECLYNFNVKNYFFLDQSFPFLIKSINKGRSQSALRISEFESIETAKNLKGKIDWVWLDFFTRFPLEAAGMKLLKDMGFKLCIVSPELQNLTPEIEVPKLAEFLLRNTIKIDAICTKNPELWEMNLNKK